MLIPEILRYAAAPNRIHAADVVSTLALSSDQEITWTLHAGLGPLLARTLHAGEAQPRRELHDIILGSDLTARLRHRLLVDTACEVIDACASIDVPVTLLKGISIAEELYPQGHCRPMTDVDILVRPDSALAVETLLLDYGYRQDPPRMGEQPHHLEPLYHPRLGTCIEVHTHLFPADTESSVDPMFLPGGLEAHRVVSSYHGRRVYRLSAEFQLCYAAAVWACDLSKNRIHPSLVVPVIDTGLLVTHARETIDWDRFVARQMSEITIASLLLSLSCVHRHGITNVPHDVLRRLRRRQNRLGTGELTILNNLIDRFLLAGRHFRYFNSWHVWLNLLAPGSHLAKVAGLPWNIAFPPSYPDRFHMLTQWQRIRRMMGRLRS